MRPIKFRAWDKRHGVMIYWDLLSALIEGKEIQLPFSAELGVRREKAEEVMATKSRFHRLRGNPFVMGLNLMQFTGLLDKNGKEIYEDDILSHGHIVHYENGAFVFDGKGNAERRAKAVLKYIQEGNEFMAYTVKNSLSYLGANTHMIVIGNVHENPELLK